MKLQWKAALSFLQYRVCDKVVINVGSGLLKVVKSARASSCSSCDTSALSFLIPERLVNMDFVEGMRKQIKDDDWCLLAALLAISDKVILSPHVNLRHTDFSILRFLVNWTMIIFCQWSSVICNPVIKLNEQAQYSPFGIQTWFNKKYLLKVAIGVEVESLSVVSRHNAVSNSRAGCYFCSLFKQWSLEMFKKQWTGSCFFLPILF